MNAHRLLTMMVLIAPALSLAGLEPGDGIQVTLRGVEEAEQKSVNGTYRVGDSGQVRLPLLDRLVTAVTTVLQREGQNLSTYNLTGPLGYLPLRQFLVGKLKRDAGITCSTDDILITSGSLQGLEIEGGARPPRQAG